MRVEDNKDRNTKEMPWNCMVMEVEGRYIPLDAEGYLVDLDDWSRAVAMAMAAEDGMELDDDHWTLINFLHRFYSEFQVAPSLGILSRNLCKDQYNCRWSKKYIRFLFPNGAKTACRYAGLPTPVMGSCV